MTELEQGHVVDGELIRILDGESAEVVEISDHLARCARCRARRNLLERRSRRLDALLREAFRGPREPEWDPAFLARVRGASARGWPGFTATSLRRAAAVVALLATGAVLAAVTPLGAWITGGVTELWEAVVPTTEPPDEVVGEPGAEVQSTEVWARIEGPALTVRLTSDAAPQRLVFRHTREASAGARVRLGVSDSEILVRRDGFEIRTPAAGAEVEVLLPETVRVVVVLLDGEVWARRAVEEGADSVWTLVPGR